MSAELAEGVTLVARCDPCNRRRHDVRPPILARLEQFDYPDGPRWTVWGLEYHESNMARITREVAAAARRRGLRPSGRDLRRLVDEVARERLTALYEAHPAKSAAVTPPDVARWLHQRAEVTEWASGLQCRRCGSRPRVAKRRLYELADEAVAAGRDAIFV